MSKPKLRFEGPPLDIPLHSGDIPVALSLWIPACVGMTTFGLPSASTRSRPLRSAKGAVSRHGLR